MTTGDGGARTPRALPSRLLVVTDRHLARRPLPEIAAAVAAAGATWIWLRDRDLPLVDRAALAHAIQTILAPLGGVLSVGADPGLAREVGARGVQVRAAADVARARAILGEQALIGVSAHGRAEVRAALDAGADYATVSPVFETASKPGYGPALGLDGLAAHGDIPVPLVALGGIGPSTAGPCLAAGAAAVAVMGGIMAAGDPGAVAASILGAAGRQAH